MVVPTCEGVEGEVLMEPDHEEPDISVDSKLDDAVLNGVELIADERLELVST